MRPFLDDLRCAGWRVAVANARFNLGYRIGGFTSARRFDQERGVQGREGMVEVYDHHGEYVGCMGEETWASLIAREALAQAPQEQP